MLDRTADQLRLLRCGEVEQELPAYGRLLLHVLEGKPWLFIRDDEAEQSWEIVQPTLDAWKKGIFPLREYPAGSEGPELPERHGGP